MVADRDAEGPRAEYDPILATYWRAWHSLQHDRQMGGHGAISKISFASIDNYAKRMGVSWRTFDILEALIAEMDEEYMLWWNEKMDEASPKTDAPPAGGN